MPFFSIVLPTRNRPNLVPTAVQSVLEQGKARLPGEINPALPPALCELIMRAMAVDKTKRFQNMDELRTALQHFL